MAKHHAHKHSGLPPEEQKHSHNREHTPANMKEAKGYGFGESARVSRKAEAEDERGERHEGMRGGVAMGKADMPGHKDHPLNTGREEHGMCYVHDRRAGYPHHEGDGFRERHGHDE